MNTKHLMKKLPSCLLGAILAAGIASTTVNAVDGNPPGLFELEGNILVNDGPGTDWEELFAIDTGPLPKVFPANMITFTGITADPAPQSIFWKGGSKDINDVSEWWFREGSVPDKDDITNAYAAAFTNPENVCFKDTDADGDEEAVACPQVNPEDPPDPDLVHAKGDLIVYFGLDRFANDGDAFAGFWFFQDEVATNGNNQFTGNHMEGDILVLVEYPQGANASPQIKVYKWVDGGGDVSTNLQLLASDTDAACDGFGGKLACARTNAVDLPLAGDPDPIPWAYTPKSGSGLPHESFYEGGINVTQLLGSTPCFAAFLAETRASRSETATLKDFVIDEFPVCGAEVSKTCDTADIVGDTATVSFSGTVTNTGGQSVFIELTDDPVGAFTAVCFDTSGDTGKCDGTDAEPADLSGLNTNTVTFTLGADDAVDEVLYEGSYTETPVTGLSFTDTVTMTFFSADGQTELDTKTASDTCLADVTPDVEITKVCDPDIGGGSGVRLVVDNGKVVVEVGNIITVHNNGEEALKNVTISDTEVPTLVKLSGGANLTCTAGSGQCTGNLALNETVVLKQTYKPDGSSISGGLLLPNTVFFNNEASAQGQGVLSNAFTELVKGDASCELCPPDPVP